MEIDITNYLKKRMCLFIIFFLALIFSTSFILIHEMGKSDEFIVSNAHIVYEKTMIQVDSPMIIQEVYVAKGEHVNQGTLLMRAQRVVSDEAILRLKNNVELAQKNLEQIRYRAINSHQNQPTQQGNLDAARTHMVRMNELYEMGAISAVKRNEAIQAYEQEKNSMTMEEGQVSRAADPKEIQAATDQLQQAEEALKEAYNPKELTGIYSPREGILSQFFVEVGDRVEKGVDLMTVDVMDNCWIEAVLSAEEANKIYLGQVVHYELDGTNTSGTVEEITDSVTESGDNNAVLDKCIRVSIPQGSILGQEKRENIVLHFWD